MPTKSFSLILPKPPTLQLPHHLLPCSPPEPLQSAMDWPSGVPGESRWADRIIGPAGCQSLSFSIEYSLHGFTRYPASAAPSANNRRPGRVHQAALACHFPPAPPPPMFRAALITSQRRDVSQGSRSRPYAGGDGRSRARGERPQAARRGGASAAEEERGTSTVRFSATTTAPFRQQVRLRKRQRM